MVGASWSGFAHEEWRVESGSARQLVGDVAEDGPPGGGVDSPAAAEPNHDRVRIRGHVDVLPEVPQSVEAPGTLHIDPPEVLVEVGRVCGGVGGRGSAHPVLGDDVLAIPFAVMEEQQTEAGVIYRRGVQAALHLLESEALGV